MQEPELAPIDPSVTLDLKIARISKAHHWLRGILVPPNKEKGIEALLSPMLTCRDCGCQVLPQGKGNKINFLFRKTNEHAWINEEVVCPHKKYEREDHIWLKNKARAM